jgi:hypothetical protein
VQPEELCKIKFSVTGSGIELTTFRFVVQYLNKLCLRAQEKKKLVILCTYLCNQRFQTSEVCNETLNVKLFTA